MAILVGAQAVATSGNVTAAFPTGYTPTAGDFAVVLLGGKATTLSVDNSPASDTGSAWTKRSGVFRTAGNPLQCASYYRALAGGETAPAFAVPTDWSGAAHGMTAQMLVIEAATLAVDGTTPFDVADQSSEGAADPFDGAGITTATDGALVVSAVVTNDDNALALVAGGEQGFTLQMGGANYDTVTGGDQSFGLATKVQVTHGAVTPPSWDQTVNGIDGYLALTFALRPAGGATAISGSATVPLALGAQATVQVRVQATAQALLALGAQATAQLPIAGQALVPLRLGVTASGAVALQALAAVPLALGVQATAQLPVAGAAAVPLRLGVTSTALLVVPRVATAAVPLALGVTATARVLIQATAAVPLVLGVTAGNPPPTVWLVWSWLTLPDGASEALVIRRLNSRMVALQQTLKQLQDEEQALDARITALGG